ncbi:MAG: ABC-2 family transporter protein [Lachnospiraceae bacterium]|nr:ABC-2 family transporter protein [Lachnospiraceae bacterium]
MKRSRKREKKISAIRLYRRYVGIHIRSTMQYKTSFLLTTVGQFIFSFNVLIGITFLFNRFHQVADFTYSEVLICYAIVLMEFALAEMFGRGFDLFSGMVKHGEFDRVLVRPRNEILQVLGSKFELSRIGRMFQAVIVFIYGLLTADIDWNRWKVMTVVLMLIGGSLLFAGIFMIQAGMCFFTLEGLEFMNILTDAAREYGKYPVSIYGKPVLLFCTFLVPYALIQYYPLLVILGRTARLWYSFLPLAAAMFLIPCLLFWRFGVRCYRSSGS